MVISLAETSSDGYFSPIMFAVLQSCLSGSRQSRWKVIFSQISIARQMGQSIKGIKSLCKENDSDG